MAEYDAAKPLLLNNIRIALEILRSEEDILEEKYHRNRRDMAFCPRLAQVSDNHLIYAAGAGVLI